MFSNNYSATSTPEKVTKANQIFKKSGFPVWVRVGNPKPKPNLKPGEKSGTESWSGLD
jgi:hypothetical protein